MIIIIATFGQAVAGQAHAVNVLGVIIVWRVIMGIGVGGDYPLSAIISSEFASTHIRGRLMTAVFANQGWGQFAGALVALIIVHAYKDSILHDDPAVLPHVDQMWRILIGLGCVPGVVALYFRLTIPETPRFTMDIERNVAQASQDVDNFLTSGTYYVDPDNTIERVQAPKATKRDFFAYFGKWENGKVLLGTAYSWFALDVSEKTIQRLPILLIRVSLSRLPSTVLVSTLPSFYKLSVSANLLPPSPEVSKCTPTLRTLLSVT